jgi:RHS repeat-associated protein
VVTRLGHDAWRQPLTSQVGSQPVVTQQLNERGQLVRVVDAAGAETRFVHDARGEVVERVDPRGARVLFERDALGRVVRQVDRNGDAVTTSYTPSGKLSQVTFPSAARGGAPGFRVEFGYDLLDRVVSMRDGLGTAVNVYEAGSGRLIETTDSLGGRLRYAYDTAGRLLRMTWPDGRSVSYRHDALNRIAAVRIDWLGVEAVPEYDAAGRLVRLVQFNGTETRYGYDAADRLTSFTHARPGGGVFAGFGYGLDANGNRVAERREPEVLLPWRLVDGGVRQGFDAQGQRLLTHGAVGGTTHAPVYSPEGQLERLGNLELRFDAAGRVVRALSTGGAAALSHYAYDGAGNRLRAVRNGVETRYLHDVAGNVVAELDGTGAITRYYIHGLGLLALVEATGPRAGLFAYHADGTGHIVALTDASGTITHRYSYGSFGEVLGREAAFAQPFTYAGLVGVMEEPGHGLHYMRARYYHVASHRFVSEDPSGFNGGLNLYAYVGGNPLGYVDPSGLERVEIFATGRAFGVQGFHHLYAVANEFEGSGHYSTVWGRGGSSGLRLQGGSGGFFNPRELGHVKVGEVFLPGAVDSSRFFRELDAHGHDGLYVPGVWDCHSSIIDAATAAGGRWIPNENYQGRVSFW